MDRVNCEYFEAEYITEMDSIETRKIHVFSVFVPIRFI